jgi:hypothetical protein
MFLNRFLSLILLCSVAVAFGCSSQLNTPTLPGTDSINSLTTTGSIPAGVSDFSSDGAALAGMGTLGFFSLNINPAELTAELVPLRNSALEDVLEIVDITNFMTMSPCYDCVKLQSISVDMDGNLILSIGIRHPFPAGNPIAPITGRNRGDLHVFNIEGYIISDGTTPVVFSNLGETMGDFNFLNPDGYSAYMDGSWDGIFPTTATIHPYILHFDDYTAGNFDPGNPMGFESVTDPGPSGNLVMAMGCDYDYQDYIINIQSGESLQFIYAVGCTYAVSVETYTERFSPEYRIPQHNKKAASEVWVEIVSNDLAGGDSGSSATIAINVVDISHGVAVGSALNEMLVDSSVSEISVEVLNVTALPVDFSTTPTGGTGHDPSDPLVFEGTFNNDLSTCEGEYAGLVKVVDSYSTGLNTNPSLNSKDGISRVDPNETPLNGLFAIDEFATYQTFTIEITSEVPDDLVYNLIISTVRTGLGPITALRLDWDAQTGATDYNIYQKDPFDPVSVYTLLVDGVSTDNFYEDTDIQGNQGYQYYVTAQYSAGEANDSNEALALLENAEDNISTESVWETECGYNGNLTPKFNEYGTWDGNPANGTYHWHQGGVQNHGGTIGGYNTSSWTVLCSPVIPIPTDSTTAYFEYLVGIQTNPVGHQEAGGSVGVTDIVTNANYHPTNDLRDGWGYNTDVHAGLTNNYSSTIDTTNDWGYA